MFPKQKDTAQRMKRKSNPLIKVDEIPKGTMSLQTGSTEVSKGTQSHWMEKGTLLSKTMSYKKRVLNAPVTSCKVTACLLASRSGSEGGPLISSSVSIPWEPVRPHPGPSDSEMLGVGPSNLYFRKFSGDSDFP